MNKNIEWLKGKFRGRKIFKPQNDREIGYNVAIDEFSEYVDQLDKPETLSQEWIDRNVVHVRGLGDIIKAEVVENILVPKWEVIHGKYGDETLQNNIDYVESQGYVVIEKPVIPQFVAEFLIGKEDYMLYELFDDDWLYEEHNRVAKWLYDNDELTNNQRKIDLVMARDHGFTVEKEQIYHALIKGHENIGSDDKYWNYCITDDSLDIGDNKVHADVLAEYLLSATKDEWASLGINDDNADFVKVEVLEKHE